MALTTEILQFTQTKLTHSQDQVVMIYVLQGSLTAKRFNKIQTFHTEDLFFINPNEIYTLSSKEKAIVLCAHIDCIDFKENMGNYADQIEFISDVQSADQMKDMAHIYRDCAFIKNLLSSASSLSENRRVMLSDKLIYSLAYDYNALYQNLENHKVSSETIERMYRILSDISQNCAQKISLHKIAQQENMQKTYFAQIWKQLNNRSLLESGTMKRLLLAEKLLFFSDLNNEEICQLCGFSDKKYFYRYFQEWYHMTPLQWKNQYENLEVDETVKTYEQVKDIIERHLHNYKYIQTNTHFIQCYERLFELQVKDAQMQIELFHEDNFYKFQKKSYMTWYGFDLLVHTVERMNIHLEVVCNMNHLIYKKEQKALMDAFKQHKSRYKNKVWRSWKVILKCSDFSHYTAACLLKDEIDALMNPDFACIAIK